LAEAALLLLYAICVSGAIDSRRSAFFARIEIMKVTVDPDSSTATEFPRREIPVLPRKENARPVTSEKVPELLEADD
jgi:hypothetical protein